MKQIALLILTFGLVVTMGSCGKDDVDTEKPTIDVSIQDAFPTNCDTMYYGDTYTIKMLFKDNVELGSYSIDIHNNFDHHSHTTDVSDCDLGPVKTPVNPFVFIEDYDIESGLTEYETNLSFTIPTGDGGEDYDDGDYHFFVSLTDKEGWSDQHGISMKLIHH